MRCLRTRILTFLNPAIVRSTADSTASFLLGACFLSLLLGATPPTTIQFRLSPGPRLVGTRADRSGAGTVTATLEGARLTLKGSFSGLLAVPTAAHLAMGSLPGVRGAIIADLTVFFGHERHVERNRRVGFQPGSRSAQGRPLCRDR